MRLVIDDEQKLLQQTAVQFLTQHSPVSRFRQLREDTTPLDLGLYRQMAELGWSAMTLPERYEGLDLGFAELALVLEALGAQLAPEPFVSTLMASQALLLSDATELKARWLPKVAAGHSLLTLAHAEPQGRYRPLEISTRAVREGAGWRLHGTKTDVLDAAESDAVLCPAAISAGGGGADTVGLFLVSQGADGMSLSPLRRVDCRSAARITLDGVTVGDGAVLSTDAGPLIEAAIDRATIALCAEMLGGMNEAFRITLDYLKERKQFGVPIGSFQALKHRAAYLYTELTLARSAVLAATRTVDDAMGQARIPMMASLVKARCSDTFVRVASECLQMFGGVGMTDEYDIGLYLKRARACEFTFGDAAYHRDRWATLSGY